jgi:peptide methionine sulfoxide reductase msrA/msrB
MKVTYDADRITHEVLMRTYWKHVDPTKAGGQFKQTGPQYRAAVWVSG